MEPGRVGGAIMIIIDAANRNGIPLLFAGGVKGLPDASVAIMLTTPPP